MRPSLPIMDDSTLLSILRRRVKSARFSRLAGLTCVESDQDIPPSSRSGDEPHQAETALSTSLSRKHSTHRSTAFSSSGPMWHYPQRFNLHAMAYPATRPAPWLCAPASSLKRDRHVPGVSWLYTMTSAGSMLKMIQRVQRF